MRDIPFIPQSDPMDCGAACIGMIASYFGKGYSPAGVSAMCGMTAEGASLLGLSKAAEAIGFRTMAVEATLDGIAKEELLPFIAHWSKRHFIVVYRVSDDRVWVADPARGLLVLGREEFLEQWGDGKDRGIALLLEPVAGLHSQGNENENNL